jgi:hypothetical protein
VPVSTSSTPTAQPLVHAKPEGTHRVPDGRGFLRVFGRPGSPPPKPKPTAGWQLGLPFDEPEK